MLERFVGVDIGGTKMHMLAEYEGEYIEKRVATGLVVSKEYLKEEIAHFVGKLPFRPLGIGVAIPGLVEHHKLVVASDVVPALDNTAAEFFSPQGIQVSLINDVQAALVEESFNYPADHTLSVIMTGTGIAAATQTNGKHISGAKSFAGELGFAPIAVCDQVRTVDSLASGSAILTNAGTDLLTFLARLQSNEEQAVKIVKEAGFYFGIALAFLINLFNPHVLVVGGGTATYPGYLEEATKAARKYAIRESFKLCQITTPKDSKRIVALGARRSAHNNLNNL